jgi:hypothetical protein
LRAKLKFLINQSIADFDPDMDESISLHVTATYYGSAMPATEVARFRHEAEKLGS